MTIDELIIELKSLAKEHGPFVPVVIESNGHRSSVKDPIVSLRLDDDEYFEYADEDELLEGETPKVAVIEISY